MAKNLDINKYSLNKDEFNQQVDNLARSSLKLQVILHQYQVTNDEFVNNIVKFIDLKEYLENPEHCFFGYEIFRDEKNVLRFKKIPANKEIAELMSIQNNLWLSDISNNNVNLRLNKTTIVSEKQSELENRFNLIQKTLGTQDNIKLKGVYAFSNDILHNSKLAQAFANELAIANIKVIYIKTQDLFKKLISGFEDNMSQNSQIISILERSDVLILDEMGNESTNSWFLFEVISQILSRRLDLGKLNIFFSNLSINQLSSYYLNHRALKAEKHKILALIQKIQDCTIEINF
ncbi:ATP-binding protein [Mycoplasmopsis phocirhinis]|uniref:ATP-binding protein n=1 Tax=Mycoplasmopsis phocirhinis TaxID=142650 RepID=A0A4P6MMD4_9BACT|nr:ATP-binding protein [Mycoplasmopsis phocirhinis]QBF34795.1 ATP-binding protein [Mycoplasmopsis phocirhinis]